MAESMFESAPATKSRKTWRMVVIGAAVPFAMLAAAPAVGAAEIEPVETVNGEQLPPVPVDPPPAVPDVGALNETCQQILATLQAQAPDVPPAPLPVPAG